MSAQYELNFNMRGSGFKFNEVAGEALGEHKLVYRGADGYWWLADASAAATMPTLGITMSAISANRKGEILWMGFIGDINWTWTAGDEIYASTTAGELTQTPPAGATDIVQVVAIANSATVIQFQGNVGAAEKGIFYGNVDIAGTLTVDTINEHTVGNGIDIEGVHLEDNDVTAETITSTIATGTPPLTITSTTLVTNLNSDMVDGLHFAVGDATVLSGATTVVVTHGMSGTPRILLTPKDEIEGRDFWVSAEGALTFTINISMIDLGNNHSFNWMGIV